MMINLISELNGLLIDIFHFGTLIVCSVFDLQRRTHVQYHDHWPHITGLNQN